MNGGNRMKKVLSFVLGMIAGTAGTMTAVGGIVTRRSNRWQEMSNKHLALFLLMNEFMRKKQEGKHIQTYFEKHGYKSVALYGLSYVGERVLDELKECNVDIKYAVDRNAASIYSDVEVITVEDELPDVDVMIVTAVYFFDEIYATIANKVRCPVVSLEDVLHELE